MDRLLEVRAEGLADALEAYMETEEIETGRVPKASAKRGTFFKVTQNLLSGDANYPKLAAIEVKITDADGAILARLQTEGPRPRNRDQRHRHSKRFRQPERRSEGRWRHHLQAMV